MSTDSDISFAAEALKRAAPREFDVFLASIKSIAAEAQTTLLAAPPEGIVNAQGQAQMAARLLRLLRNCSERVDTLQRRNT